MISSIVPGVKLGIELCSLATQRQSGSTTDAQGAGFWISQLLVEASFFLIMVTGWGLFRLRRWAVIPGGFLAVISLLVCVWFILTQGMQHGPEPYVAIWCGVALSLYTVFGVWKLRSHNQLAERGTSPNGGLAEHSGNSAVGMGPPSVR